MHYKQLLDITSRFPRWDVYETTMQDLKWHQPEFDIEENIRTFENFLGASHSLRRPLDKGKMLGIWMKDVEPYAMVLEGELLESLDVGKLVETKEEKLRVGIAIEHMYSALSSVSGVGDTNVSKLLHLRLPCLFVMTDADIRSMLKIFRRETFSAYSYAFNFLMSVKSDVNEALDTLCKEKQLTQQQGIEFLRNSHSSERPLAKLMDECYYTFVHKLEEFPKQSQAEYFATFARHFQ